VKKKSDAKALNKPFKKSTPLWWKLLPHQMIKPENKKKKVESLTIQQHLNFSQPQRIQRHFQSIKRVRKKNRK